MNIRQLIAVYGDLALPPSLLRENGGFFTSAELYVLTHGW
jgi:hypothetical protein